MSKKKSFLAFSIAGLVLSGGLIANAGTSWSGNEYNTVPGNNGYTTSSTQTKTKTNASSDLNVTKITSGYVVDVRAIGYNLASGAWVRNVSVGSYDIPNPTVAGGTIQLQYSSGLSTPSFSMTNNWRSN